MTRTGFVAAVLFSSACDPGDVDPAPDVDGYVELSAPLAFELTDGQRLRIHDAELADGRIGLLELSGDVVDATHGRIALTAASDDSGDARLVVDDGSARWVGASQRNEKDENEALDAELEGLELWGFDRAVFRGPRGPEILQAPIVVNAVGVSWTAAELHLVASATESRTSRPSPRGSPRMPPAIAAPIRETAHADGSDPRSADVLTDEPNVLFALDDPCQSSDSCDPTLVCIADTSTSDGAFRCLAECVAPASSDPNDPRVVSETAVCLDDDGCCEPTYECHNGACEPPAQSSGSGGGNPDGSSAGGGCDPDGDDVISACDANPNESCKADNDGDGCANSFDDNDADSCQCAARIPRPNSLAIGMFLLAFFRGRTRRSAS